MKKTKKLLTIAMTLGAMSSVPMSLIATSCGSNKPASEEMISEQLLTQLRGEAIKLFYNKDDTKDCVTGNAHVSYYWGALNKWITNYAINKLGVEVHRDKYFSTSEQIKEWDEDLRNYYGNIWFDIPATVGYENRPKFCLQAHMDMVIAEKTSGTLDWKTKPITPTLDGDNDTGTIHSLNNETSLGADDGCGIATILALVSNKNWNHGPIKVLFTADEEVGDRGAYLLGTQDDKTSDGYNVLKDCKYILNLDTPSRFFVVAGSGGVKTFEYKNNAITPSAKAKFTRVPEKISDTTLKQYKLECKGLLGGHSAEEIVGHGNAIEVISRLWEKIQAKTGSESLNYIVEGKTTSVASNQIPSECNLTIISKLSKADIDAEIVTLTKELTEGERKVQFAEDFAQKTKPTIICTEETTVAEKAMANSASVAFMKFISEFYSQKPSTKSYAYNIGVAKMLSNGQNMAETCANIGPWNISLGSDGNYDMEFTTSSRSLNIKGSSDNDLQNYEALDKQLCNKYFGDNCITQVGNVVPFIADEGSYALVDKLVDGYKLSDISKSYAHRYFEIGGLETSAFFKHFNDQGKAIGITSLGANIDYEHNVKETLHLDSIKPLIRTLTYTLQNLK